MDDFIFDLQRFDETPTTVLPMDSEYVLTFGSEQRTVVAGTDNISLTTIEGGNAVISLSTANENFFVNDTDGRSWNYKLSSAASINGGRFNGNC